VKTNGDDDTHVNCLLQLVSFSSRDPFRNKKRVQLRFGCSFCAQMELSRKPSPVKGGRK